MNLRTKILVSAVAGAAVITSIAAGSASSEPRTNNDRASAASAFDIASRPAGSVDPALYQAIVATIGRNPGLSSVGSFSEARSVGSAERGITGVVAAQRSGGLCFQLEQAGTIGTNGCVDDFPADGRSGSHGVVADQFTLMGLVASDVTSLSVEFADGAHRSVAIDAGVYTWTGSVEDAAPTAIVTERGVSKYREEIDLAATLAWTRARTAPPAANVME